MFTRSSDNLTPLADKMRPLKLDELLGQDDLIGHGKILRCAIENDQVPSMILWGPPGTGKTSLASVIANMTKSNFQILSAVSSGKKDLMKIIEDTEIRRRQGQKTILFIDEIHRWNKAQQDALLPYVENGAVILVGATTENPSFEIQPALLSRCRVFVLQQLKCENIIAIIKRVLTNCQEGITSNQIEIEDAEIEMLARMSNGDARVALNFLDYVRRNTSKITLDHIKEFFQRSHLRYDKNSEEHYNIISALHKSMRGSDADAALYWLARMLEAGEDPLYIARRVVRFASEDIGLANSRALEQAVAAYQACHFLGMPECNVILAQVVVYMSRCKKSNSLYVAYKEAAKDVFKHGNLPVPLHLRNAPTNLMKDLSYGKNYKYSPDYSYKEEQQYMPDMLLGKRYIQP